MGGAAALCADLHDALVFAGCGEHGLTFDDVHADRFLAVDIRTCLDRGDHRQRVPMIRRGNEHDIQILFLQHLAVIAVDARFFLRHLPAGHQFCRLGDHPLIDIAQRYHFDRSDLDQAQLDQLFRTSRCRSVRPAFSDHRNRRRRKERRQGAREAALP
jgi:hypothetical protein